jgi:pimeloyl-ACP methyl ester carboxylesterase
VTLSIVMLAVLLLVLAAAMVLLAYSILSPPRMTDGKAMYLLHRLSPGDLDMQFETLRFEVRDANSDESLSIISWWIPHPSGSEKTVIFIHGYADAKVGAIAWAPTWQQLGYNILAIDLRAHGESAGRFTTAGVYEKNDLDQIINQLRIDRPNEARQVALFGISMGAAVALATAAMRNDIAAIVLESPYINFRTALRAHIELLGLPLNSALLIVWQIMKWMSGANLDEIQPPKLIASTPVPLMIIQSGEDSLLEQEDADAIKTAMTKRSKDLISTFWELPDVSHLQALANDPRKYFDQLEGFLR